jgi:hypothetical protein
MVARLDFVPGIPTLFCVARGKTCATTTAPLHHQRALCATACACCFCPCPLRLCAPHRDGPVGILSTRPLLRPIDHSEQQRIGRLSIWRLASPSSQPFSPSLSPSLPAIEVSVCGRQKAEQKPPFLLPER